MSLDYKLTPREIEVLRLLSRGFKDCQIAERLVIETTTVKTHLNRIFPKLLVNTRTEAVVTAIARGLINCPCSYSDPLPARRQQNER